VGDVQHSGTFNAHLVSILAGVAFCREITSPAFYPGLLKKAGYFLRKAGAKDDF